MVDFKSTSFISESNVTCTPVCTQKKQLEAGNLLTIFSCVMVLTVSPVMFGVCGVIDRLFFCRASSVLFFQSQHILIVPMAKTSN